MINTEAPIVGAILDCIGINYRKFPCRNGEFCFCTTLVNSLTFDLKYDKDGIFRLWRFVGTVPISEAGKRWEYRKTNYPYSTIGMEVTDEGNVEFYVEQIIDINDPQRNIQIDKVINSYVNLISDFPFF